MFRRLHDPGVAVDVSRDPDKKPAEGRFFLTMKIRSSGGGCPSSGWSWFLGFFCGLLCVFLGWIPAYCFTYFARHELFRHTLYLAPHDGGLGAFPL